MAFEITSTAFDHEGMIPSKFTCDGENVSPELAWDGPPEGTQSFALINDDPDAPMGTGVHWVVYNIPASARGLGEGVPSEGELADGTRQGRSSFGSSDYGGPCPPGGTHRYYFKLYAVDTTLDLEPGATKSDVLSAIEGHTLGEATLMGRYSRS